MTIKRLTLRRFRNYAESRFEFEPKVNIIQGPNAQGKTSLLEALHLLAIGRSFRTSRLTDMIQKDTDGLFLEAEFESNQVDQRIALTLSRREKKVFHNQTEYPSLSSLIGMIPVITMTPDDDLIKGGPEARRKFLDLQIAQCDPLYLHYLTRYQRAMRQRNQLLRTHALGAIEPWEHEMARSAAYVVKRREALVDALQKWAESMHDRLSGKAQRLTLCYHSQFKGDFLSQYRKTREKEAMMGYTLSGPHRDDLAIKIDEQEARHFASEGQKRTSVTALRLASWELMKEQTGREPILLIDDFGLSLDASRREHLLKSLPEYGQVFITCVDPLPLFCEEVKVIELNENPSPNLI